MAAKTGRTTSKWVTFKVDDTGSSIRAIPVNSMGAVGVTYEEIDVSAWQDAVRGGLPGMPSAEIEVSGPFDSTATTGSHTVLAGLAGGVTVLSLDVQFGIRQAWDAEPQFGLTATGNTGYLCTSYLVNPNDMTYTARFIPFPGSAIPAWGTAAET